MSLQLGAPLMLMAALLQATLLARLRVLGGQLDLVVVIVLAWAVLDRQSEGLFWAFVGGLCLDLFSGAPLGVSSLALVPVTFLIGLTEAGLYRTNILLPIAFAGIGALAYHILYALALQFFAGIPLSWLEITWYVILPSVFFDLVLIIPALRLLGRMYDRMHVRQARLQA